MERRRRRTVSILAALFELARFVFEPRDDAEAPFSVIRLSGAEIQYAGIQYFVPRSSYDSDSFPFGNFIFAESEIEC